MYDAHIKRKCILGEVSIWKLYIEKQKTIIYLCFNEYTDYILKINIVHTWINSIKRFEKTMKNIIYHPDSGYYCHVKYRPRQILSYCYRQ